MTETRSLLESHEASYPDPIRLAKGAPLVLTGREDSGTAIAFSGRSRRTAGRAGCRKA